MFTGGTVVHCFLGEKIDDPQMVKLLVKKIAENYTLPYFTITPTFSVCPVHGYICRVLMHFVRMITAKKTLKPSGLMSIIKIKKFAKQRVKI